MMKDVPETEKQDLLPDGSCKKGIIDLLHELISVETANMKPLWAQASPGKREKAAIKARLQLMRHLGKRDAYYRVIHILRGQDTQFPRDTISDDLLYETEDDRSDDVEDVESINEPSEPDVQPCSHKTPCNCPDFWHRRI